MKRLICIAYFFIAGVLASGGDIFGQPAAPSNLVASAVSTSRIDLKWDDNSANEFGFTIQRKLGAGGSYSEIDSVAADVTSYSSTGLFANTHYFYRVRAYGVGGSSAFSNEADATTLPNPSAAPSNLTATAVSSSQINLAWQDNSTNEVRFKIERKTGVGGTYVQIDSVTANVTSYSDTGLTASTTYFYRVRTFDTASVNSAYSNESNATTFNPAPTLTSISPNIGNRLQTLDVVFTGTNFIDGVTSAREVDPFPTEGGDGGTGSGVTFNSTTVNSSTSLTANITISTGVASGAAFAVTNSGPGGGTSAFQGFALNNPAPTVTSISPTNGNRLQTFNVVFTGTNFITGISSVSFGGTGVSVNSTTVNSATQITANISLTSNAVLGVRNVSVTNASPGGGTETLNSSFTVNNPVPTLTSISPTSGDPLETLNVVFTGTNFVSGTSVNVGSGITVDTTIVTSSTSLTATLTIVSTATGARNFSVTNSTPGGGTSGNQTFTVNDLPPAAPSNLTVGAVSSSQIELKWVTNGGNIKIERKIGIGGTYSQIDTVAAADSATTMIYNDSGLAANTNYFYRVRAYNASGNSAYSNESDATTFYPAPTLTSIAPNIGTRLQTLDVVFTGTNFIDGITSVNVGSSITINSITVDNSTSLTANLTITAIAATGAQNFSVTNSAPGGGTSANQTFTVNNPAPTLTSIAPTNGNRLQMLDVVFTGTNFIDGISSVSFGADITLNSTTINSATQITANITIGATAALGPRNVSLTNSGPGGGTSANKTFTVASNPTPTLTSISPTSGSRLQTLDVVFTGTNFIDGVTSVKVDSLISGGIDGNIIVNSTTVNSSTSLTANLTIMAAAATGARHFYVTNSGPGGGTSGNRTFTVNNPAPTLASLAPDNGDLLQTLDVVFTGTNFIAGVTSVNVDSGITGITTNSITVNSSTSLTANLTITANAGFGARIFFVTNSGPGGGTSANQTFTVNNPAPTLTSIAPNIGTRLQTLDVVFTGTNFIDGVTSVNVDVSGITVNSTIVNSSTSLTVNLTISPDAATGAQSFSVTNSAPGGGTSANQTFMVSNPAPTLASLSSANGNRLQTLDVVFTGTNFIDGVTSVNVGSGITINSMTVDSSTSLTANLTITATAATGARNFSVTNSAPGGGTSANQTFTVNNPAPTLTSIAPTNGNRLQMLDVVFTGTNFIDGISSVSFGADITLNSTTINSATQITANITIGATAALGPRNVSVTNSGPGGGTSANKTFTVGNNPAPTLTSISPTIGNRLQTLDVIFTGTNFIDGVTSVKVDSLISGGIDGNIIVNSTTVNSSTSLTANLTITAAAATGARYFYVTNSGLGGGTSANQTFNVNNPAPTLTSLSPTDGNRLQTLDVIFTGTNFIAGVSSVNFGANITVNSTVVNPANGGTTQITANITIDASAPFEERDVSVVNALPGGGMATLSNGFTINSNPAPFLTSIAPTNGNRLQTLNVIFTGTNFIDGVSSVSFGADITVDSSTVNSATQITANITIGANAALGPRNVSITNAAPGGGSTVLTNGFTVGSNPSPTLTSISPIIGNRLQTLDVVFTGTNFIDGVTSVNAGSGITVNSITVNPASGGTSLTANLIITAAAATGARNFSVTNSAPGGGTSANQTFTVNNPVPTLTGNPASGNRGQTLDVVFFGTNFISGVSSLNLGADITVDSMSVSNPIQIGATITIGINAALGPRNVSVTNAAPGGGTATLANGFTVGGNPVPTLTSISPTSGGRLQTLAVVLTGTNFISGVSSVNFGADITVDSTIVNSATQITANITIGANAALGPRNVSVTNTAPGGGSTVLANGFTVGSNPSPTLTSISPINGNRLQTLEVVFTGTNFIAGVTSVNVGDGITVNSTTVNSLTSLTANLIVTAAATTGARNFSVTNSGPGGGTSGNQTFTVNNPVPTLVSLGTASGNRGQTLNVGFSGTNFISGVSSLNLGPDITVDSMSVSNPIQISATITIGINAALGPRNVSVTNAAPGGGTATLANGFTVGGNPVPTLTSISPTSGGRLQTLAVVLTGTNFISGVSSVSFGADITVDSSTVNSATQITANITIGANAALGPRNVSITNAAPGGGTTVLANGFTVGSNPAPTLASISPINGNHLQTLEVVFTGTNFISGVTSVNVGDGITVNSTTVNSTTSLTANLTITIGAATGARSFSVSNSGPGGGTSVNRTFTVRNPAPTLTSITPITGNRLQTLEVIFMGTNFISGVSSVSFGAGITVNSMVVDNTTQITANITIISNAALTARNVSVTNAPPGGGTAILTNGFTVAGNPSPTLASISLTSGNRLQALEVIFTGTNFISGVTAVSIGAGITINSTTVNSSTSLTANLTITAAAATGGRNFSVVNSGPGGGTSAIQTFNVENPSPTLLSIAPVNGDRLQTLDVVFTGTNFISGVTAVSAGAGMTINSTTVNSSTNLTANLTITAVAAIGARNFSVTNNGPGGGTSGNQIFTVNNPGPTLTSVSPPSGNRLQTLEVVLAGTNFINGVSTIDSGADITVNSTTVNSATQITANITIGSEAAFGARDISVSNAPPGGGTVTLTNGFTVGSNPAPTLTSISPPTGNRLQTLEVIFTGTNFINDISTVDFGADITINSIVVNSATQITANITIGSNAEFGARDVSVTNAPPGGGTATLTNGFTVGSNPAPTLASISPIIGNRLQTLDVVFTGMNFISGITAVNSGPGITVNSIAVNGSTSLTANLTITVGAATGPRNFSVTNAGPGGGTSGNRTFTVNNPSPTVTNLSPPNGRRLQTLAVVFTGANFISVVTTLDFGAGITVNSTTVNSPTQITANITIDSNATLGARDVSVTNAPPGGGTVILTNGFTVGSNPTPTLASIAPTSGRRLQTLEVVFTGTNFINEVTTVSAGPGITVNSTTVNSSTSLTANLTITAAAATGARSFAVINSGPGGGTSTNRTFTVNNPAPTLTSLSPTNGNRLQTLEVVFTGTRFISGVSSVNFGAGITVNSTTVNSPTQITANITISSNAALGARNASVTNTPPVGGTAILTNGFVIGNNPVPTLTGLSPSNGDRLQTLEVVLTGTNFISGVSSVNFGAGITLNSTTVNSSTQITANITIGSNAALGGRDVLITNAPPGGGIATLANGFTVGNNTAPTLTGISPIIGNRLQTLDVIFTGTNFISGSMAVNAGSGIAINSTTVNSPTSLTANLTITASAAAGTRNFSVTNTGAGGGTSASQTFMVNNPSPTLTSISPSTGSRLQTLEVIFTGTNFISDATTVDLGADFTVNSTTVNSSTSLTANLTIAAAATIGERSFSVTNIGPGGGTSGSQIFTVSNLPPVPLPPSNLIAEAMSIGEINLRWTDNSNNESGFKIVRRVGPEASLFTVGPNVQNYQDAGLARGAAASYQVFAFNTGGDSPSSNFAGETTATGVRCDVTRDFIVDANDVDFEIRVILQNPLKRVTHLDSTAADTNLDGKINVIDAVDMVNESLKYLLAGATSSRENNGVGAGSELRLGAAEIIVGTSIKSPLTISAAEPVAALQLKIRGDNRALAMGDPFLSAENRGMTLATARGPDQLAILIYSLSGDCIAPGTRELLQFFLQAESADFSKTGLQIESALLIGKSGAPIPVRITNDAANLKINLPDKFTLSQNYPNPFDTGAANPKTEIVYSIPTAVAVKLAIYNVLGHEVALLVNSWQTPGLKKVFWDGRDRQGKKVTAGVYFYRLEAGDFVYRQKMVLK